MTGLDVRYIPLSTIQEQFWDKNTDAPMAAGIITFWADEAHSVPKDIYEISGTFPNYSYTNIGSSITLSAIGTFNDSNGNNFIPYLFPYDGDASNTTGTVELYYILVTSADSMFQFSISGIPNISQESSSSIQVANFVPNGQFLLHNLTDTVGTISELTTQIAPGGWQFVRGSNLSTDFITFPRFGSAITNPNGNPRYACRVSCTAGHAGDTVKMVELIFDDVNRFSDADQFYTLYFASQDNIAGSIPVSLNFHKYFGSGGSASIWNL